MGVLSLALKSLSWFLRFIEFCCAAIILGIFSYFLAVLSNHHLHIPTWIKAVEGISGAAVLYTLFALFLVFCLGGMAFFSALGMLLDLAFVGAFIYLAYATRNGRHSCNGHVNTPLGSGDTNGANTVPQGSGGGIHLPSLKTSCRLEKACFAVALVGLAFFLFSFFSELAMIFQRRREKAFGPSPKNNYTSGTEKRKFWQRKQKCDSGYSDGGLEAQKRAPDSLPEHNTPGDMRQSYQTDTTAVGHEPVHNKYGPTVPVQQDARLANQTGHPAHIGQANQAGYTTQPTTHSAYANQPGNAQYANQTERVSYLNYGPERTTGYGAPRAAEMPGETQYQAYQPPRTDAY